MGLKDDFRANNSPALSCKGIIFRGVFISLSSLLNIYESVLYSLWSKGVKEMNWKTDTVRPCGHGAHVIYSTVSEDALNMPEHFSA